MNNLSSKWQKTIVWLTGYLNIIAFFLAGGYVYLKTEDEDVRSSGKTVLALLVGFAGIDLLCTLLYNVLSVANVDYSVLSTVSDIRTIVSVVKIVVFVALFILDLCGIKFLPTKRKGETEEKTENEQ
ncbi:MAG: hypothetical protein J6A63_01850 [Clostridia bacterium]|nr:hypothetical protein [Clostridia bacterium]